MHRHPASRFSAAVMTTDPATPTINAPRLADNVMHFARLLRRAGLPVGPSETIAAQQALTLIDLGSKAEARSALRAAMVHRRDQQEVFDHAFALFWRDPSAEDQAAAMALLDGEAEPSADKPPPAARRVAEAFRPADQPKRSREAPPVRDMTLTVSQDERLQQMDFEAMGAAEIAEAKREIRRLVLPLDLRRTRRRRPDSAGPLTDLRRTIRASLRQGGEITTIARSRRDHPPTAAGRAVRHLRINGALCPDLAAFPACSDQ